MSADPTEAAGQPVTRRTVMHAATVALAAGGLGGFSRVTGSEARPAAKPMALTPRQLAGQRVIYSYAGLTVPEVRVARRQP